MTKKSSLLDHFYHLKGHKSLVGFVILTAVGSSLAEGFGITLIFPLLADPQSMPNLPAPFSTILGWFAEFTIVDRLRTIAALLLLIVIVKGVLRYAVVVAGCQLRVLTEKHFKIACSEQLFKVGLGYFQKEKLGRLHTICNNYTQFLGMFVTHVVDCIPLISNIAIYLAMIVVLSWKMSIFAIVLSGIASLSLYGVMRKSTVAGKEMAEAVESVNSVLYELLAAMKTIRIFGSEKKGEGLYGKEVDDYSNAVLRTTKIRGSVAPLFEVCGTAVLSGILIVGPALFFEQDGIGLPGILGFLVIFQRVSTTVMQINRFRVSMRGDLPGYEEVFEFLDAEDKQYLRNGDVEFSRLRSGIEFENVEFAYGADGTTVLKEISLSIPKGKKIGIVGLSGAGKSTLIELLLRFYDPQEGQVIVDGLDLRQLDLETWRKGVGVVAQDVFLFHDTVGENIGFARPGATQDEIEAAAQRAHAHEFILSLPDGYNTVVGDRGVLLSGGQKQRIAIARAIIIEPEILVFDEATSALDTESEKIVQGALDELSEGKTTITIAHRLSTVFDSDKIIVIDAGEIVEEGVHEELVEKGGTYKKLIEMQELSTRGYSARL